VHPVLAYIDPGSGSLLIQVVIASLVAAPFVLRQQIGRLIQRIKGQPVTTEPAAAAATTEPDPAE
jgi:hypothetical protein